MLAEKELTYTKAYETALSIETAPRISGRNLWLVGGIHLTNESEDEEYSMFTLRGPSCDPVVKEVLINGVSIDNELDTGASAPIVSQETYQRIAQQPDLQKSTLKLTMHLHRRVHQSPRQHTCYCKVWSKGGNYDSTCGGRAWPNCKFNG